MPSLRHLCGSLQRSAKIGKMIDFTERNARKDGTVRTGGISTITLQCGRVHLCGFSMPILIQIASLRRLCVIFAYVFAHLCFGTS